MGIKEFINSIFKRKPDVNIQPTIDIPTDISAYTPPKTNYQAKIKLLTTRTAHHCYKCDKYFYAGSKMCRRTNFWGGITSYDHYCLECSAKKWKRMAALIKNDKKMYDRQNMFAKFRGKE